MAEPIEIPQADKTSIARTTSQPSKSSKQRSSHNAIKHGIFSDVAILPGESGDKYRSLLKELKEALQPVGRLEELLVEKLASIAWRHRRLLAAEGAEIRQGSEFVEWDKEDEERRSGTNNVDPESFSIEQHGLIRKIHIPDVLDHCLELLRQLQEEIDCRGLDKDRDSAILELIYGSEPSLRKTLLRIYLRWVGTAEVSEEERQREGYANPEQCKKNVLLEIENEIRRLRKYERDRTSIESERTKLEVLRRTLPHRESLDRLLRYESSLERSFDRTLNQLERMQRLRRGQPVAPRIDVTVSK